MGLKSIFKHSSDLREMKGTSCSVKIDDILHKTKIDVIANKKGAEAAAATVRVLELAQIIWPVLQFQADDHLFLFVIRHTKSNLPLLVGLS